MTIKVLFVCLGNICRSPTAHGVFTKQVADAGLSEKITIDSAGTSNFHQGGLPDDRSIQEARLNGYDLSFIRSRQIKADDFVKQDLILAMDRDNLKNLNSQCPEEFQEKLFLLLSFADNIDATEVPDPYYGGDGGFAEVLKLIEHGGRDLLQYVESKYLLD